MSHRDGDGFVIRLPDPRILLLITRSVLFAAVIISFPCLLTSRPRATFGSGSASGDPRPARWIDDPFYLPLLLNDLKREGLLCNGYRAIFLGDAHSRLALLKKNNVKPVPSDWEWTVRDASVDFVFSLSTEGFSAESFLFLDRVLRVGGITVIRLNSVSDTEKLLQIPSNYRLVYIRRFGSTIIAIKKIAHEISKDYIVQFGNRKLLDLPERKMKILDELENVPLEPPIDLGKDPQFHRKFKFLSELIGDSLKEYPRRVFIDVGPPGRAKSENWFSKKYPKKDTEFEIIKLDESGRDTIGISEWLVEDVKKEDYVVMKAEAGNLEEILNGKENAISLIDELFLECNNQWERTYWECLALYGKVIDEGIQVHQWWG